MKDMPELSIRGMAKKFVRESIIEDAAAKLVAQIMTEVADAHIAPRDAEITKLKSQLEEARRGLKIALHALKNVDGPFIEHEGAHGIFLAKEHDCTCWDAEQTVTAFLNGSAK